MLNGCSLVLTDTDLAWPPRLLGNVYNSQKNQNLTISKLDPVLSFVLNMLEKTAEGIERQGVTEPVKGYALITIIFGVGLANETSFYMKEIVKKLSHEFRL